jgi:Secretion system C-terminal sorting domain
LQRPVPRSGEAWLYPNPTGSSFFVKLTEGNTGTMTIADLSGKTLHTLALDNPGGATEINRHLSAGVYLVRILTDSGAVFTEKLVVQPR